MEIEKAIERAETNKKIKDILDKGGFLVSGYVILDCSKQKEKITKWDLNYYNPNNGNITNITIEKNQEVLGEEGEPLREKDYSEFAKKIKTTAEDAIKIAEEKIGNMACMKMIVSLQKDNKHEYWNIAFMSPLGSVSAIRVDVETGEILFSETSQLIEKQFKGQAS